MRAVYSHITQRVVDNIAGRVCDPKGTDVVLDIVAQAGAGNYLEIGVLHGGTAIAVALLKKELGQGGEVYCVDPLNGYYSELFGENYQDSVSGTPVTRKILDKNIKSFGVEDTVKVIDKKSYPYPEELKGIKFAVAFIDGWHWDDAPLKDWNNVKEVTNKYVVFDNYDGKHESVTSACLEASKDKDWDTVGQMHICYILKKKKGEQ